MLDPLCCAFPRVCSELRAAAPVPAPLTVSVPLKAAFGTQVSLKVITRCSYLSIPLISGTKSELTREVGWIYT